MDLLRRLSSAVAFLCLSAALLVLLACSQPPATTVSAPTVPPHPDAAFMDRSVQPSEWRLLSFIGHAIPTALPRQDALDDLELFGWLLSQAWSGYDYHSQVWGIDFPTRLAEARARLEGQASMAPITVFQDLLGGVVAGIHDRHLSIEGTVTIRPVRHLDFFASAMLVTKDAKGELITAADCVGVAMGTIYRGPSEYLFPVWSPDAAPRWRLGVLAEQRPASLALDFGGRLVDLPLLEIDRPRPTGRLFSHAESDRAAWLRLGACYAVPSDTAGQADLAAFVALAPRLRGLETIVLDLRGNGGGSDTWGLSFLDALFDSPPLPITTLMADNRDLLSPATLQAWRAVFDQNAYALKDNTLIMDWWRDYQERTADLQAKPRRFWSIPPERQVAHPHGPAAFKGKIILLFDRGTASAGEDFRAMMAEYGGDHCLVGENSGGFQSFSNVLHYVLPNSGIRLSLPSSLALHENQRDSDPIDGIGWRPDWWTSGEREMLATVEGIGGPGLSGLYTRLQAVQP